MKRYSDLIAEFAEKYAKKVASDTGIESDEIYAENRALNVLNSPIIKALVQEVARLSAENVANGCELNPDWWQEFTKEKE